ncbi:MAG: PorV/PorQ family protein [Gemmatirosa sp.]
MLGAGAGELAAQSPNEAGAQPLLLPLGARTVGIGGAAVAGQFGIESQVSNPAGLGFATAGEVTLLHGQDFIARRDLLGLVLPSRRLGTFGVSGYLVNLAEFPATDDFGNQTGTLYVRNVAAAASYASTFARDLSVGLTYRVIQLRVDCSGSCPSPGTGVQTDLVKGTTSMIDLGAQYDFRRRMPLAVGAAVRHLGLRLQVKDADQADPLPTQLAVGARYDVEALARGVKDARLRVSTDIVRGLSAGGSAPSVHLGAEGTFRNTFSLRGGWVQRREDGGPSVGFGYSSKRVGFDVARQLSGFSVDAGEPPTYVSLRYHF